MSRGWGVGRTGCTGGGWPLVIHFFSCRLTVALTDGIYSNVVWFVVSV